MARWLKRIWKRRIRMRELKIYGTVFNNAEYIDACLNSLKPLGRLDIYVVDNYSTDGTVNNLF